MSIKRQFSVSQCRNCARCAGASGLALRVQAATVRLLGMPWDIPDAHPGGMLAVENAARAARARTSPSQLVMPLFSNAGFVPYLRNLLCSLQRLNVDNWFVIALDNETCPLLGATVGHCVHPYRVSGGGGGSGSTGSGSGSGTAVQSYGSFGFYWIAMQRPLWLYWLLGRGYSVINCDLDIVWLHDPRPHLAQPGHASADMLFQPDAGHGVNGGFYVARATPRVLGLFEAWLADLAAKAAARKGFEEQHSLNRALRVNGTRLRLVKRVLDERRFPNGKIWWTWSHGNKAEAFIVHCNWAKSNKKGRLRRDNLWFLDEHDQRCQAGFDPFEAGCDRRCVPVKYCAPGEPCALTHNCAELHGWHPRARQLANCSAEPPATSPKPQELSTRARLALRGAS